MSNENGEKFRLTPKGFFEAVLQKKGLSQEQSNDCWHEFNSFCQKRLREDYPESAFGALLLDGDGGEIIGLDLYDS